MYKIKSKKSKDKTGGKNAYRKKRKEKKSKGLFYLIFTLTIIAALTISCKNKATGTNEFAWEDADIKVPNSGTTEAPKYEVTKESWGDLIGKTIISENVVADSMPVYFWGEFTENGFKWGTSHTNAKGTAVNYRDTISSLDLFVESKANFSGKSSDGKTQTGNIKFTVNQTTGKITDVTVTFTDGVFDDFKNIQIKCGMPKE